MRKSVLTRDSKAGVIVARGHAATWRWIDDFYDGRFI